MTAERKNDMTAWLLLVVAVVVMIASRVQQVEGLHAAREIRDGPAGQVDVVGQADQQQRDLLYLARRQAATRQNVLEVPSATERVRVAPGLGRSAGASGGGVGGDASVSFLRSLPLRFRTPRMPSGDLVFQ